MKIESINIGRRQEQQRKDRVEITGIFKTPLAGPVEIKFTGIEHDAICDDEHHGGPDQAIYVYGGADYEWWSQELGRQLPPGTFGENLTVSGLESAQFKAGDCLRIGEVILQVAAPRIPCGTFATRMNDAQWVKKFRVAGRPGLYCRVLREGIINVGDAATLESYVGDTLSIAQMYADYYEKNKPEERLRLYLTAPVSIRERNRAAQQLETLLQK